MNSESKFTRITSYIMIFGAIILGVLDSTQEAILVILMYIAIYKD